MKRLLRQFVTRLACAAALLPLTPAFGATVDTSTYWNGDLADGSTKEGLVMSGGTGCSFADGYATTTASIADAYTGLMVDLSADSNAASNITVLVKYSGFEQGSAQNNAILGILLGENNELLLAYKESDGLKIFSGVTSTGSGAQKGGAYKYADGLPEEGALMMTVVGTATAYKGVFIYLAQKNDDGTYKPFNLLTYWHTTGTEFTDATKFLGIKVGGSISKIGSYHRSKMVIEGLSINYGISNRVMFPNEAWFPSESAYVKKSEQLFLENMPLSVLSNALFTAYANGSSMDVKDAVASGYSPAYTVEDESLTSMTRRFCAADSLLKTVVVRFSQKGDDIYYKAESAGYVNGRTTDPETVTTWNAGAIAESATAVGYAFHDITATVPYTQVADVSGSKNWSALVWVEGADRSVAASKPTKDTDVTGLVLTGTTTLTMNEDVTTGLLSVQSDTALTFKYASTPTLLSARMLDFSDALGKVKFDCSALTVSGSLTLMSGVLKGAENIDVAGSKLPDGVSLIVTKNAVKLSAAQWTRDAGTDDITDAGNWQGGYVPYQDGVFTDDFVLAADADWSGVTFGTQTDSRAINLDGHVLKFSALGDTFGTILFSDSSSPKAGELVLTNGTTKLWSGFSTDDGLRIRIAKDASIDLNGVNNTTFRAVMDGGSSIVNTGAELDSDGVPVIGGGMELAAGATATLNMTGRIQLRAKDNAEYALALNGGTLVKAGAKLGIVHGNITGPGTLQVTNNEFNIGAHGITIADDVVIEVKKGGPYMWTQGDSTVPTVIGEGSVRGSAYYYTITKRFSGLLTVEGKGTKFADGMTLDLSDNTATYAIPSVVTFIGSRYTIDLTGRKDLADGMQVVSWTDATAPGDDVTFKSKGAFCSLIRKDDGLYIDRGILTIFR